MICKNNNKNKNTFFLIAGIFWFFIVCMGLWTLVHYENSAGLFSAAPSKWPKSSAIMPSGNLPTLVLFAHPKCPCTRATINELAKIITHCKDKVKTYVVFYKPNGYSNKWAKTDLWYKASNIPDVILINDNGSEMKRFHAHTSGQSLLYNTEGQLMFNGGITAARGHDGNNIGRQTVISILETGKSNISKSPVFGCSLSN
jgi:hypothetical protein